MNRRHAMPFGTEVLPGGELRFRLWAPGARTVALCLADRDVVPMAPSGDGWYELVTPRARAGSRYRFQIDGGLRVPDPASRYQPEDAHGPSEVIDPRDYEWSDAHWRGRPWEEAVLYELHVGCFSADGNFAGVRQRLDYLADLGVTAIELMPLADFPGKRNWGYDGVLPFAPDSSYGRPEDLKRLVDAAHARGLMVFLDVVYNHFGPDGNYLHAYAPPFFTDRHHTPWGAAINFDGAHSRTVREFFIHNALYWLEEFHLDGLRLDAVHAIADDSRPDILEELATRVRAHIGRAREVHLVLENEHNAARYLEPARYDAQWNDDIHHALHVLATGEHDGYYRDYADAPARRLGRCLSEGFAYQGEASPYRGGAPRGEPSAHLPPTAFVNFLQNHDQIGNRAFGERIGGLASPEALRAATAIVLLAPAPPLLFMGQEFAAATPFLFFCDFAGALAAAVRDGRRNEFARFARFADASTRALIPDPNDAQTFVRCRLDWDSASHNPHAEWLALHRELLSLRAREIAPRVGGACSNREAFTMLAERAFTASWTLGDGSGLTLFANLGDIAVDGAVPAETTPLFATSHHPSRRSLVPWSVTWFLEAS